MILETERLILREMSPDDYDALYEILSDSDAMKHYPYTFDEARVRNWINKNMERYSIFGFGLWAVVLKANGEMIGDCGISMQNINGVIKPEIGYHIKRKYWRQGFAKEAASECRDWAFENTPFRILYSYMKKSNVASSATAVSNGMSFAGDFTDKENEISSVYAITRGEWEKLK